jgi:hypothetical protein
MYRVQRSTAAPQPVAFVVGKTRQIVFLVTFVLALGALYVVMSHIVAWGQITYDDMRYGRPRSFHLVVPANVTGKQETHFLAMNLDRQVVVFEIPTSGDPSQIQMLPGPYLFGAGEDLTPLMLYTQDVNRDNHLDIVLRVKNEEVVYVNRGGAFSLLTVDERQQLLQGK